ncbi:protein C10 [Ischnura elegans]|uniref:protein C10 n=1 Tax=Ischnura elegans TaxID=197161 RepID=UPI001ED8A2FD|nr:protein C10 [Ischnura elegans]
MSTSDFTVERAKAALNDVLEAINSPENLPKVDEAKENAGNDMLKMMQFVFPIITQIQMEVIQKYGFAEGREGIVQFAQIIRTLEKEDQDLALLHTKVRSHFLPPITIPTEASSP